MLIQALVYSDKLFPRIARHSLFWLCFFINRVIESAPVGEYYQSWSVVGEVLEESLLYFPVLVLFVYTGLYFILPVYLVRRRYKAGFAVTALTYLIALLASFAVARLALTTFLGNSPTTIEVIREGGYISISAFLPVFLLAMAIKMTRLYMTREKENQRLLELQLESSLHLMKARLQPEILLDALADIYTDITGPYRHAPQMILNLSELLHYILYETAPARVELAREIKMMQDFLRLKSDSREEHGTMEFAVSGKPDGKTIPPLLCLPLIDMIFRRENRSGLPFRVTVSWWLEEQTSSLSLVSTQKRTPPYISGSEAAVLDATRASLAMNYPGQFVLEVEEGEDKLDILMEFSTTAKIHS